MADIAIRAASSGDAAACAKVMRNSIERLCVKDHGNDPGILADWLANKTPEIVGRWIADEGTIFLVAVKDSSIVGVGAAKRTGEITLLYVDPSARFSGVSTALVAELETRLSALSAERAFLTSTNTALGFYSARGYTADGEPKPWRGDKCVHPMSKAL